MVLVKMLSGIEKFYDVSGNLVAKPDGNAVVRTYSGDSAYLANTDGVALLLVDDNPTELIADETLTKEQVENLKSKYKGSFIEVYSYATRKSRDIDEFGERGSFEVSTNTLARKFGNQVADAYGMHYVGAFILADDSTAILHFTKSPDSEDVIGEVALSRKELLSADVNNDAWMAEYFDTRYKKRVA